MDSKKWLVAFAAITSLSLAYYFLGYLPDERFRERMEREKNQTDYMICMARADNLSQDLIERNGTPSADGTRVTASPDVFQRADRIKRNAQIACSEMYPASKR